jgi:hypothetical protein
MQKTLDPVLAPCLHLAFKHFQQILLEAQTIAPGQIRLGLKASSNC